MGFAERIKEARVKAGLSQGDMADQMAKYYTRDTVSRTAIAQWESGATHEVEARNLLKAAKVLHVSAEWLLFGKKERKAVQIASVIHKGNNLITILCDDGVMFNVICKIPSNDEFVQIAGVPQE